MNPQVEKLQKKIRDLKTELTGLEGQKKVHLDILLNDFGVESLEDARKELKKLEKELVEYSDTLNSLLIKANKIIEGDI